MNCGCSAACTARNEYGFHCFSPPFVADFLIGEENFVELKSAFHFHMRGAFLERSFVTATV
jgi:hypothetical protein